MLSFQLQILQIPLIYPLKKMLKAFFSFALQSLISFRQILLFLLIYLQIFQLIPLYIYLLIYLYLMYLQIIRLLFIKQKILYYVIIILQVHLVLRLQQVNNFEQKAGFFLLFLLKFLLHGFLLKNLLFFLFYLQKNSIYFLFDLLFRFLFYSKKQKLFLQKILKGLLQSNQYFLLIYQFFVQTYQQNPQFQINHFILHHQQPLKQGFYQYQEEVLINLKHRLPFKLFYLIFNQHNFLLIPFFLQGHIKCTNQVQVILKHLFQFIFQQFLLQIHQNIHIIRQYKHLQSYKIQIQYIQIQYRLRILLIQSFFQKCFIKQLLPQVQALKNYHHFSVNLQTLNFYFHLFQPKPFLDYHQKQLNQDFLQALSVVSLFQPKLIIQSLQSSSFSIIFKPNFKQKLLLYYDPNLYIKQQQQKYCQFAQTLKCYHLNFLLQQILNLQNFLIMIRFLQYILEYILLSNFHFHLLQVLWILKFLFHPPKFQLHVMELLLHYLNFYIYKIHLHFSKYVFYLFPCLFRRYCINLYAIKEKAIQQYLSRFIINHFLSLLVRIFFLSLLIYLMQNEQQDIYQNQIILHQFLFLTIIQFLMELKVHIHLLMQKYHPMFLKIIIHYLLYFLYYLLFLSLIQQDNRLMQIILNHFQKQQQMQNTKTYQIQYQIFDNIKD
ncbi:hypothetical protein IMG5_194270 [Ichthyophthirius multifiliis]|uniref:Transmembrane protein n=1 Tax=Ichthyophthirius multifiliis TaxID=5932 RepID=G0R4Q9_ICHMU|nr:hypothetical protein IMG5_194270 [Ichthyophthirius multifiliis]EGR27564.1 hypothetical protein IMG5_194270 [Ichthyophthirius multifiliis]|eukprot:XP_004025016.1 hypothetical protein IMG5_194270 [Ichthyophthirius multifiliis]